MSDLEKEVSSITQVTDKVVIQYSNKSVDSERETQNQLNKRQIEDMKRKCERSSQFNFELITYDEGEIIESTKFSKSWERAVGHINYTSTYSLYLNLV